MKNGLAHVQHDKADHPTAARTQLSRRLVPDEAERLDRRTYVRTYVRTRSGVACATISGRLGTLETVPTETPACAATSLLLIGASTKRPSWAVCQRQGDT